MIQINLSSADDIEETEVTIVDPWECTTLEVEDVGNNDLVWYLQEVKRRYPGEKITLGNVTFEE